MLNRIVKSVKIGKIAPSASIVYHFWYFFCNKQQELCFLGENHQGGGICRFSIIHTSKTANQGDRNVNSQ